MFTINHFLLVKKFNPKAYIITTITVYYLARCVSRGLLCEAVSTLPEAPLGICDAIKFALQKNAPTMIGVGALIIRYMTFLIGLKKAY